MNKIMFFQQDVFGSNEILYEDVSYKFNRII